MEIYISRHFQWSLLGEPSQKLTFLVEMSLKGRGGGEPLSAKKKFFWEEKEIIFWNFLFQKRISE